MSNATGRLFWLTINGSAAGPFSIAQIHEKLASGEIQWRTPACEVGDNHWMPIVEQPQFGPPRKPKDEAVQAQPPASPRYVESIELPAPPREPANKSYPTLRQVYFGLLVADIATTIASIGLTVLGFAMEPVDQFAVNNGPSPADGLLCIGAVILLPAMIAAWVGMWRFSNWGRWTYLGYICAGHVFGLGTSLFDFSAQWHLPDAVASVGTTIGGILLAVAYFSPLAAFFRASVNPGSENSSERRPMDRTYA